MKRLTPALLVAAALTSSASAQSFFFDSGSGWLVRSTTAAADLSFPDGGNTNNMWYTFTNGDLIGYQWGGSLYPAKNGRVQFTVASDGADNDRFNRVATAFSYAYDAYSESYGWAAIPSNRSGAMTGHNPSNAPALFASKIGDTFQMEVYASNMASRFGWAKASAAIRHAPTLQSVGNLTATMTNLTLLDVDPVRPGIQVLPGNIALHATTSDAVVSRDLIDFGWIGTHASPFRDAVYRDALLEVSQVGAFDLRLVGNLSSDDMMWAAGDADAQKTLRGRSGDYLVTFTNADIGKTFNFRYNARLEAIAWDADGLHAGSYGVGGSTSFNYDVEVIPGPGAIALGAVGMVLSAVRRRR